MTENKTAIFAAGCFWGVQYYFDKLEGVIETQVGYTGGESKDPTHDEVYYRNTGHLQALKVTYDPARIDYESLVKYFFEIHDFEQTNGQGPDIGDCYLSAIFYQDEGEREIAEKIINILEEKGYKVATTVREATKFWPGEIFHQKFYEKTGHTPYCHRHQKIF